MPHPSIVSSCAISPTGLSAKIWDLAGWPHSPASRQGGPWRWVVPGQGSLWDIAVAIQDGQHRRSMAALQQLVTPQHDLSQYVNREGPICLSPDNSTLRPTTVLTGLRI
jgi:hypothetical protein